MQIHWLIVREGTPVTDEKACQTLNFCIPPASPAAEVADPLSRNPVLGPPGGPGLTKPSKSGGVQNNNLTFVHITDIHIDPKYEEVRCYVIFFQLCTIHGCIR